MSFGTKVNGLKKLPLYLDGSMRGSAEYVEYNETFDTGATRKCLNYHGEEVECPVGSAGSVNWTMPMNAPVKPDADYYAFTMYFTGPKLRGADCGEARWPTDTPCFKGVPEAFYEGEFALGDWVIAGPEGVDPTFQATWLYPPENFGHAQTNWPVSDDNGVPAYLVNPSPVWPVPDSANNEFGMCLFDSLSALPSAVSVSILHFNRFQADGARWHMGVIAYELEGFGPPPSEGNHYGQILHWA